ncbi:uncharacterized protein LOC113005424 isoform X2 [Solenopsis invicta]|uniref:uncharacterized protein LOC113005424 isoform X2 n=1 Tax=Solenopsis invicta TaxID=13686 RepID=UPI00193CECB2|nr:uncharacterized protein LOC113005424 isoform X2 [Solenopsis invicta]
MCQPVHGVLTGGCESPACRRRRIFISRARCALSAPACPMYFSFIFITSGYTQEVVMRDRLAAERACKNSNPIIDGRKAKVNLVILGAKPRDNLKTFEIRQ